MMSTGFGIGGLGMGLGFIFWIIVLAALYYVLTAKDGLAGSKDVSALKLLKERYAMGEIDRDEYLRIRQDI